MSQNIFITVFVPVFNGEKYLSKTLNSIRNQSYQNFEVLLVDDSSTDASVEILYEYAKLDSRFKVFIKDNGGMVSASWNYILPKIKGEYLFYSSQDDIFSEDLIERMVEKQEQTNADTVLPDMIYYYENRLDNKITIGLNGDRSVILTGRQAFKASLDWTIHGFPLTRTSLIIDELFYEDAFDTDELITRKLFLKSNKVVFSKGIFHYRQDNFQAITKTFSAKNFYTLRTLFRLYEILKNNNFEKELVFEAQKNLLNRCVDLLKLYEKDIFSNRKEKLETSKFLTDFFNKHIAFSFCKKNFGYALQTISFKYLTKLFILKLFFILKKAFFYNQI